MLLSKDIYKFKWGYLFLVYVVLYAAISFFMNGFVFTDSFYYSVLGEQLSADRIEGIVKVNHSYLWIGYLLSPLFLLLKLAVIAGALFSGIFMFDTDVSYKKIFRVVMIAELVGILAAICKLAYFLMWPPQSLNDVTRFYPLSITQLIRASSVPVYFVYPLQQLNLFEVAYWLLIADGISVHAESTFFKGLKITACSYGVALALWMVVIVFIQLQFS
jgi:hypothetical protein